MTSRESIYSALFALLAVTPGLNLSSRRLRMWTEVASADQPALFLVQKADSAKIVTKIPTVWTLHADIILYGNNGGQDDRDSAPMTQLNPIIDAIVAKLLPPADAVEQTLGGLVERCRIEGEIITDEGILGDQAVVVIPLTILVPQ